MYIHIYIHIGIYQASFTKVAVREMTSVITISQVKTPLAINQYVRISRGKSWCEAAVLHVLYMLT